jgi:hypothetical protein
MAAADQATVWFAVLQAARRGGDARLADRALAELERAGVRVLFATGAPGRDRTWLTR